MGDYSRGVRGVVGSGEGTRELGWGGGFRGGMGWGHSEYMSRPKINVLSSAKTEEVLAATSNPRLQSNTYRLLCFQDTTLRRLRDGRAFNRSRFSQQKNLNFRVRCIQPRLEQEISIVNDGRC